MAKARERFGRFGVMIKCGLSCLIDRMTNFY